MADTDKESKTEEPTAKRRRETFEKGSFAQAQEIGVVFALLGGLVVIVLAGPSVARSVMALSASIFGNLGGIEVSEDGIPYWASSAVIALARLAAPFVLTAVVVAIIAGGLQSGFKLTPKVLGVKWEKLDPIAGSKRLVSMDTLTRFGLDLLKMAAMAVILYIAVKKIVKDPIFYAPIDFIHIGEFMTDTLVYVFLQLVVAMGIVALISYLYQKRKTHEGMKMTKEEVKQERKDQDMSPELKQARMRMAMRLLQGQMLDEVPTADVVVTNPTHYAVALKYERGVDHAPIVLAKGENAFAQRIKEVAAAHGVPVVENKMVARMLYKVATVGAAIPVEMFQSVAEILAFVYKTHRYYFHQLKARRSARQKQKNG